MAAMTVPIEISTIVAGGSRPLFDFKQMGLCQEALDDMAVCAVTGEQNLEDDNDAPGSPLDSLLFTRRSLRSSPTKTGSKGKGLFLDFLDDDSHRIEDEDLTKNFEMMNFNIEDLPAGGDCTNSVTGLCQKVLDDMAVRSDDDAEVGPGPFSDSEVGSGPPSPLDSLLFVRRRRTFAEELSSELEGEQQQEQAA